MKGGKKKEMPKNVKKMMGGLAKGGKVAKA